jgi:CP family cyanate transporter-like MFS transporter
MSSKTLLADLAAPSPARPRRGATLLGVYVAVGLLAIGFNLRIGVSGVGLLLPEIERGLAVPPSVAGLLNTIPVVAFGAFAFLTPPLVRRVGLSRLLWLTMAVAAIGIGMRVIASPIALFGGTVLLGAALAVANVCMPMAIKRDFPQREDLMMGLYTVALSLGAALVAALMVPLMSAFGGSWRHALGFWALPAVIALLIWTPRALRDSGGARLAPRAGGTGASQPAASQDPASRLPPAAGDAHDQPTLRRLLRDPLSWAVTAFMGLQSLTYYASVTWNATLLRDAGTSAHHAGVLLAFGVLPALVASFAAAAVYRVHPTWLPVAISTALQVGGFAGLLLAPSGGWVWWWMTLLGLGQGSAITLALGYIVLRSPDPRHAGILSTMAQGIGYLVAALGPLAVGVLYTTTRGWGIPIGLLIVLLVAQFAAGAAASQDRLILGRRPAPDGADR